MHTARTTYTIGTIGAQVSFGVVCVYNFGAALNF